MARRPKRRIEVYLARSGRKREINQDRIIGMIEGPENPKTPEAEAEADDNNTQETMIGTQADMMPTAVDRIEIPLDTSTDGGNGNGTSPSRNRGLSQTTNQSDGDEETNAELWSVIVATASTDSAKAWELLKSNFPSLTREEAVKALVGTSTAADRASMAEAQAIPGTEMATGGSGPTAEAPDSADLIRLTLRKPMGIVFEPPADPQRGGVRIWNVLRSGAAALSRRLEVGDELLGVNGRDTGGLSYDETLDLIIEADPEHVDLLFRRPGEKDQLKLAGAPSMTGSIKDKSSSKDQSESKDDSFVEDVDVDWDEHRDDDTLTYTDASEGQASDHYRKNDEERESFAGMVDALVDSLFDACAPLDGRRRSRSHYRSAPFKKTCVDNPTGRHHSQQSEDSFGTVSDSFLNKLEANKEMKKALVQVRAQVRAL